MDKIEILTSEQLMKHIKKCYKDILKTGTHYVIEDEEGNPEVAMIPYADLESLLEGLDLMTSLLGDFDEEIEHPFDVELLFLAIGDEMTPQIYFYIEENEIDETLVEQLLNEEISATDFITALAIPDDYGLDDDDDELFDETFSEFFNTNFEAMDDELTEFVFSNDIEPDILNRYFKKEITRQELIDSVQSTKH